MSVREKIELTPEEKVQLAMTRNHPSDPIYFRQKVELPEQKVTLPPDQAAVLHELQPMPFIDPDEA